jgi:hypothetical protein
MIPLVLHEELSFTHNPPYSTKIPPFLRSDLSKQAQRVLKYRQSTLSYRALQHWCIYFNVQRSIWC